MRDWLAPSTMRWPDATEGPWELTLVWAAVQGRAECAGLSIVSIDEKAPGPITATLMRALPVARLIATARRERFLEAGGVLVEAVEGGAELDATDGLIEGAGSQSRPWSASRRGRPIDLHSGHYAEVAAVYSDALAAGGPPLKAVVARWTVSRPTASRWVAKARQLGLLPQTDKGRARGNPSVPSERLGS